jgi:hypothetical protein
MLHAPPASARSGHHVSGHFKPQSRARLRMDVGLGALLEIEERYLSPHFATDTAWHSGRGR